jgi:ketosteroid isomerase-like protein
MSANERQAIESEERLRQAMLASDVSELDRLLAPELIFTSYSGEILTKQDDLAAHQSGVIKITELTISDRRIQLIGNIAIVMAGVKITGSYAGEPANGNFRFTRIWTIAPSGDLHVVNAHISMVM